MRREVLSLVGVEHIATGDKKNFPSLRATEGRESEILHLAVCLLV